MDALQSIVAVGSITASGSGTSPAEQGGAANGTSLFGEMFAQATSAVDTSAPAKAVPGGENGQQSVAAKGLVGSIVSLAHAEGADNPEDRMEARNLLARVNSTPTEDAVMQKKENGLLSRAFCHLKNGTENSEKEETAGLDAEVMREDGAEVVSSLVLLKSPSGTETEEVLQEQGRKESRERAVPAELLGGMLAPLVGSQQGIESKASPDSEGGLDTVAVTSGSGYGQGKAPTTVPTDKAAAAIQGILSERQRSVASLATQPVVEKTIAEGENCFAETDGKSAMSTPAQLSSQNSSGSAASEGDVKVTEADGAVENQGHFGISMGKSKHSDITGKTSDSRMVGEQRRNDVEIKAEINGDAVLRRLPSGVTVVNPAQTVARGNGLVSVDGYEVAAQGIPNGRVAGTEGEKQAEHEVKKASRMEATEGMQNREASPSDHGLAWNQDSENGTTNQKFAGNLSSAGLGETGKLDRSESVLFPQADIDKAQFQENILSQVKDRLAAHEPVAGSSKITLKLNPGELGELQIQVRLQDQRLHVDIAAQNHAVKEVLLQNIDQLKETLSRQNIAMERFDVSTGNGQWQNSNHSFSEGQQAARQQFDGYDFAPAAYYAEESMEGRLAYADTRESSLIDMRY